MNMSKPPWGFLTYVMCHHREKIKSIRLCSKIKTKKGGKDQETIQSSTTPEPGYLMGKYQKYNKQYKAH